MAIGAATEVSSNIASHSGNYYLFKLDLVVKVAFTNPNLFVFKENKNGPRTGIKSDNNNTNINFNSNKYNSYFSASAYLESNSNSIYTH